VREREREREREGGREGEGQDEKQSLSPAQLTDPDRSSHHMCSIGLASVSTDLHVHFLRTAMRQMYQWEQV